MLKAVILDDELRGSMLLQKKLEAYASELTVIGVFNDPLQALTAINDLLPDVLFLDVEMPPINGFQFLEQLGAFSFEVIFVTAYDTFTLDALRISALDYLLKPVDEDELKTALARLRQKIPVKQQAKPLASTSGVNGSRLALPTAEGVYLVKKTDIVRIEAMNNYSTFFLQDNKKIVISKTLKEYEQALTEPFFFRVNRSCIVNLEYVVKYRKGDGGTLELTDGKEIEVSSQRKEELMIKLF